MSGLVGNPNCLVSGAVAQIACQIRTDLDKSGTFLT